VLRLLDNNDLRSGVTTAIGADRKSSVLATLWNGGGLPDMALITVTSRSGTVPSQSLNRKP
jgi:hypothetical protein